VGEGKGSAKAPKNFTVSKKAYQYLSDAESLLAEKKYDEALEELERMKRRKYLNDYERALMWQLSAGVWASKGKYKESAKCLEEALKLDALPEAASRDVMFNLGELLLASGEYKKSSAILNKWIKQVDKPQPKSYYIVATASAQAGRYAAALPYAKKAVEGMKEERKGWLQLLLSLYFELKQNDQLADLLKRMIKSFPEEKSYWLQLSAVYAEMDKNDEALAVLEMAYAQNMLTEEKELINLAKLYVMGGVPSKAVQLIEKKIEAGKIGKTPENMEVYISALLETREDAKALTVLEESAGQSEKGELYLQLARIQVDRQQWKQARVSIKRALDKAQLNSPGSAYLLLGMVNYNTKRNKDALIAFNKAKEFEPTTKSAQRWIDLLKKRSESCSLKGQEGCSPE